MTRNDVGVVRTLLRFEGGSVSCAQFMRAAGVSRQRASFLLRRMVEREVLRPAPSGPVGTYVAGPLLAALSATERTRWVEGPRQLWTELERCVPVFAYVRLARWSPRLLTRAQARGVSLALKDRTLLVLDFEGVTLVSIPFAQELSRELGRCMLAFVNVGEHESVLTLASSRNHPRSDT